MNKDKKDFSFQGCVLSCELFTEHIRNLFKKGISSCKDFQCVVPGVFTDDKDVCKKCPLPKLFCNSLGDGPECSLGKNRKATRFTYPWETEYC